VSNDGKIGIIAKRDDLLMDHQAKDTQLGSTAIVELDGTLRELGLLIKVIPSKVNVSITEVTNVFIARARNVLHEGNLQKSNEGNDLALSVERDGVRADQGGNTVGVGVEGMTRVIDVAWEVDTGTCNDVAKEGKLGDASVLDLDIPKTIEPFLANIAVKKAKRIEETQWWLSTKLILEGTDGSGGLDSRSWGEGSGRADKGGDNCRLHVHVLLSKK